MSFFKQITVIALLSFCTATAFAANCCNNMGGIHYCDSSAGRFVCQNGYFSACYCTKHAVMDLQKIQGCCLWHGGVMNEADNADVVVCRDGSFSETCSIQSEHKPASSW